MQDNPHATVAPREAIEALAELLSQLATVFPPSDIQPEALSAEQAARFCGVSVSTWHDVVTRGLAPEGVVVGDGRARRWLRSELLAWLRAGASSRSRWDVMRRKVG